MEKGRAIFMRVGYAMSVTPKREERLRKVAAGRQARFILVLEDISDPHNAEAILRTCDAFGIHDVWLIFEKEERFNPRRVGKASSSSANKWLDFRIFKSAEKAREELVTLDYKLFATGLGKGSVNPYTHDLTAEKVAVMVGNEHRGLSQTLLEIADALLTIPMRGVVQSLNVSVAAALILSEITKQRLAKGMNISRNEEEKARIFNDFKNR